MYLCIPNLPLWNYWSKLTYLQVHGSSVLKAFSFQVSSGFLRQDSHAELIQFWQDTKCKRNRTFVRKNLVFHWINISYFNFTHTHTHTHTYILYIWLPVASCQLGSHQHETQTNQSCISSSHYSKIWNSILKRILSTVTWRNINNCYFGNPTNPSRHYFFTVNNKTTRTMFEICPKLAVVIKFFLV